MRKRLGVGCTPAPVKRVGKAAGKGMLEEEEMRVIRSRGDVGAEKAC